jgi:hypothetical protein
MKTRTTHPSLAKKQLMGFRADAALRAKIEAHAKWLGTGVLGGYEVSAADAVRDLVVRGLNSVDGAKR